MQHFDEHTLELYVLASGSLKVSRSRIERHLKVCHGCRETVEELMAFYKAFGEELTQSAGRPVVSSAAIVQRTHRLQRLPDAENDTIALRPITTLQRIYAFARRHPFTAAGTGVMIVAAMAGVLLVGIRNPFRDTNPWYHNYNATTQMLEIFNRENELLWNWPLGDATTLYETEGNRRSVLTLVKDLDGDGVNEVITILTPPKESSLPVYSGGQSIRVLSGNGKVLQQREFNGENFRAFGREYEGKLTITSLIGVGDFDGDGANELLALGSTGRSPVCILRLDQHLRELGRLWHFGALFSYQWIDLKGDGKKDLSYVGINEIHDTEMRLPAFFMVLDPAKISGVEQSSAMNLEVRGQHGFGVPVSRAERYYVEFPRTDIESAMNFSINGYGTRILDRQGEFSVAIASSKPGDEHYEVGFEYYFRYDMTVDRVRFGTPVPGVHQRLVSEGKITGRFDESYLEQLKRGVKYWNGKAWEERATAVHSGPPV